jgi:hypothetical protein
MFKFVFKNELFKGFLQDLEHILYNTFGSTQMFIE